MLARNNFFSPFSFSFSRNVCAGFGLLSKAVVFDPGSLNPLSWVCFPAQPACVWEVEDTSPQGKCGSLEEEKHLKHAGQWVERIRTESNSSKVRKHPENGQFGTFDTNIIVRDSSFSDMCPIRSHLVAAISTMSLWGDILLHVLTKTQPGSCKRASNLEEKNQITWDACDFHSVMLVKQIYLTAVLEAGNDDGLQPQEKWLTLHQPAGASQFKPVWCVCVSVYTISSLSLINFSFTYPRGQK